MNIELDHHEASIVLAALRDWQEEAKQYNLADYFEDVNRPSDGGIETICARITDAAVRIA